MANGNPTKAGPTMLVLQFSYCQELILERIEIIKGWLEGGGTRRWWWFLRSTGVRVRQQRRVKVRAARKGKEPIVPIVQTRRDRFFGQIGYEVRDRSFSNRSISRSEVHTTHL